MKKMNIIGMPMKYGCFVDGADLAYKYLKNSFDKIFKNKEMFEIDTTYPDAKMHKSDKKIKFIEPVMEISNRLYTKVLDSLNNDNFPITVGGDHSTAIGSISAALDYTKGDLTVIWVDAHTDIHNDVTTPSGNIHGMPLSVCIGRCDKRFDIGSYRLDPSNLYYVGVRSYEIEEIDYVRQNNIQCYMDFEVIERKIENIVNEIIKNVKTKYVHISFDLDCMSIEEFPSVNVGVEGTYNDEGGLTLNMAKTCVTKLIKGLNVCSMDIVEYNPLLDKEEKDKLKIEEILKDISISLGEK